MHLDMYNMENTIHGISDARSLIRPRFFFLGLFVIALMSIVGCKNENENLDKLLFLMGFSPLSCHFSPLYETKWRASLS